MDNQNTSDPLQFLASGSPMGQQIRAFDWANNPLGAIPTWPACLKITCGMLLRAEAPMALFWGAQGILLHNDAFTVYSASRRPVSLGLGVLDAWPKNADFNRHILQQVLAGRALSYCNRHFVVPGEDKPRDVWLSLDYSPVVDEAGASRGVLVIVRDSTAHVLSQEQLRIAQQVGGVGTFEWFPDAQRIEASDQYRAIWGIPAGAEVTETMLVERVLPEDRGKVGANQREAGNPLSYSEYRRVDADTGEVRWIARRGEVVAMEGSDRKRYIGIAMDITERKRAEDAVRDSELRWRTLFEEMHEGFYVAEAVRNSHGVMHDFRVIQANPAFARQSGIDVSQAVGKTLREVVPGDHDWVLSTFGQMLATGQPTSFELFVAGLGERWFEARARPLTAELFTVLFLDISARKATEEALRDSESRFRLLAQSMPNQVWTANREGNLDWFNDRVYAYAGVKAPSLDGDGWGSIVHPDDLARVLPIWQACVASGAQYVTEFRLRRHDGVYRWFNARAEPIRGPAGGIERWIGNNSDIEQQKAAEATIASFAATLEARVEERTAELVKTQEALRQGLKMEAIGSLTGGIAHDFNNLLQVVSGNLQLLSGDVVGMEGAERRIANAMAGTQRGVKLTAQLLAFARKQPLAPQAIAPATLLGGMHDLLRSTLGEEIALETRIADELWNIHVDPNNLENAILNLVINARDAMSGHGRLTIDVANLAHDSNPPDVPDLKPGQYVRLTVSDVGAGIPPELIEHVFEPFFTTKTQASGTGLGLSMVYGFVKQSGGQIRLRSAVGQGTTIELYFPRTLRTPDITSQSVLTAPLGGHETVLVVEDDDDVRMAVVDLLRNLGYRVQHAADAQSALTVLEGGVAIDLLLTDVVMPGPLRSTELAHRAKALLPRLAVLFTSGYAENAIVHGGRLDEGVQLLSKPFTHNMLARRVRSALATARQADLPQRNPSMNPARTQESTMRTLPPQRILLCEDEELIRMLLADTLARKGHHVVEASSARQALQSDLDAIDVLITDIGLPDGSGADLALAVRARRPNLPVIYATGHVDHGLSLDAHSAAVIKPYGAEQLFEAMKQVLGASASS